MINQNFPMHRRCSFKVTVRFKASEKINFSQFDSRLVSLLQIQIPEKLSVGRIKKLSKFEHAEQYLQRCLLIIRELLVHSRIPAFDLSCISNLESLNELSTWEAEIDVVRVDNIHFQCFQIAIKESFLLAQWLDNNSITPENRKVLYRTLEKKIIPQIESLVPGGKSTIPVLWGAFEKNIPFRHLDAGVYQLGWGCNAKLIDRSISIKDSAIGATVAGNKVVSANILRKAGLPSPVQTVTTTKNEAISIAQSLKWPIVVKPIDGARGEGISVDIHNQNQLLVAFDKAIEVTASRKVLIEQQVTGICFRFMICNYRILYIIERKAKSVEGDGGKTVAQLISMANQVESERPPWLRRRLFHKDQLAEVAMGKAGFALSSVPKAGEPVPLRPIETTEWGGTYKDVTDKVHPENLKIAVRAAELLNLCNVGVDIISSDITVPWYKNNAIINEINASPSFGGSQISKKYIADFLDLYISGNGRIPVEVIVGSGSGMDSKIFQLALQVQSSYLERDINCFITSHSATIDNCGDNIPLLFSSLYERSRVLLINPKVGAIVLIVQTDEFLESGVPVDTVTKTIDLSTEIFNHSDRTKQISVDRREILVNYIKKCEAPLPKNQRELYNPLKF